MYERSRSLPKNVQIGGMNFSIVHAEDNGLEFGSVDMTKLEITIHESAPQMESETLMHEVLHILCKLTNIERLLNDKQEEQVVSGLSNMMWQMIRDNPTLIEYWRSCE